MPLENDLERLDWTARQVSRRVSRQDAYQRPVDRAAFGVGRVVRRAKDKNTPTLSLTSSVYSCCAGPGEGITESAARLDTAVPFVCSHTG